MSLWTSTEAATATGGRNTTAWLATGVSIDTRSMEVGDLFVALADVRDGHDFVAQALEKGAAAALVDRIPGEVNETAPLLIVDDTFHALMALGRAARARARAKVIGVTGSVGKTSTKEMLRMILSGQGRVHAAERSFNNHWGVPLTLARLPEDADFAIVEIGMNQPGEIAPLAKLADLDVAMVTTVAPVHMAAFESIEDIAEEKASIFQGLRSEGVAVVNGDVPTAPILRKAAARAAARVESFGCKTGGYRLTGLSLTPDITLCRAEIHGEDVPFKLTAPGKHLALNGLGALAAAQAAGADLGLAVCDLGRWRPCAGRGARARLIMDPVETQLSFDLIDDSYNANPASMAAALDVLAMQEPRKGLGRKRLGRRIAILGDMLELGADASDRHAGLAGLASIEAVHVVHAVGPLMKALWSALPPQKRGCWTETAREMAAKATRLIDAGDVVMVKGSLGIGMGCIVDAVRKLGQAIEE